jgi:putative PEP-CTERM system histidine kinase
LKSEKLKKLFIAAVLISVIWGVSSLFSTILKIDFLRQLAGLTDTARYFILCYIFILIISVESVKKRNISLSLLFFLAIFFLGSIFIKLDSFERLSRLMLAVFSLVLIEQVYFGFELEERWRFKPLIIGLSSTYIFDLYLFSWDVLFNKLDSEVSAVRGLVHALIVPLLFISLENRSKNNLRLKISKNTAFHTIALTLIGVYLIIISSVGYYVKFFGGEWGQSLQVAIVYLSLLVFSVILFSNNFRSKLKVYISKNFFHYLFDYREEWLKFTSVLVEKNSNLEMKQQIIKGFLTILKSPAGSLWMRKSSDAAFHQVAQFNQMHTKHCEDSGSSFCNFMRRTGWVIDIDQYRSSPARYEGMKLPDWISDLPDTWLVVPLLVGDDMVGFCTLDKALNPVGVNWEVNDLLKTAGRQAAGFLTQMQATEALLEARKFAAFNRMSAFVVHDLKNIVTQLSLMMKNSQRLLSNPEFQNDMLLTVDNSLARMRQLMRQLQEGAVLSAPASGVDLALLIERLVARAGMSGRLISFKLLSPATVAAQEDRLERVLGHLVQNALEATAGGGTVQLSLDSDDVVAEVKLSDTGCGMSQAFVSSNLFKPFQTTKQQGMGIGAYECSLYVQELGGAIQVDSALGAGTSMTIRLPLMESLTPSEEPA